MYSFLQILNNTEKKVEPKRLHPRAVLENSATLEGGAVFFLKAMDDGRREKNSPWTRVEPFQTFF